MTSSALPYPIHPIADVVGCIDEGEDPWLALGDFLHDWWCYAVEKRRELIMEPPAVAVTLEGRRWAALCAAVVEELCRRTAFPCPEWINEQDYFLAQPWYYYPDQAERAWLLSTTPEPFKRRNVFVGGTVLDNKYELKQMFDITPIQRRNVWTPQEH
ncbi:hypothetical protein [Ktedonospora formicarum]|uniref:Uncharacterized protein n=1 Tax=Ktedonospora formicarum TaxID=2778364 RepID=A0A8J3I4W7_9CHLR|nr:hypothetical protein [Ktedonospora formicarum]GHO44844.1 hypothetical protein KSX_30070 [Ktedonospora formicarum]